MLLKPQKFVEIAVDHGKIYNQKVKLGKISSVQPYYTYYIQLKIITFKSNLFKIISYVKGEVLPIIQNIDILTENATIPDKDTITAASGDQEENIPLELNTGSKNGMININKVADNGA